MNYLRHWSLSEPPFAPSAARFFFLAEPQREATQWFQDVVLSPARIGLLTSPSGCGVTTLFGQLSKTAGFDDCAVEVVCTSGRNVSTEHCYQSLACAFGVCVQQRAELAVHRQIDMMNSRNLRTVWVIDQIGKHSDQVAGELASRSDSLTVIASVSPMLSRVVSRTLKPLVSSDQIMRSTLRSLNQGETSRFISHSLRVAHCRRELFSESAKSRIYEKSMGRFRHIARLARQAMDVAAKVGCNQIEASHIDAAAAALKAGRTAA